MKARRRRVALPGHLLSMIFGHLDADDAIAAWIDECCERDRQAWETRAALFASWSAWAIKAGEPVGTQKELRPDHRGLTAIAQRKHAGRGFCGLSGKCRLRVLAV